MLTLKDLFIKIKTEKPYLMSPQTFIYVVRHQYLFKLVLWRLRKRNRVFRNPLLRLV